MWKKSKTLAKDQTVGQKELRRLLNSRLCHQKEPHPWCQTWSFRAATNEQTPRRCCRKLANPNMVVTKPFWKDDTRMTNTASLCQMLGGQRSRFFSMTNLHWKTTPILQQERKNSEREKAELETMRISKNPTTVVTASGEVLKEEEAMVYVRELDLFVTVVLLGETPADLSQGKLCEDDGYTYHWTSGQKPTSHQQWQDNQLQNSELRTIRCPWSVDEFLYLISFSCIFIAGNCD